MRPFPLSFHVVIFICYVVLRVVPCQPSWLGFSPTFARSPLLRVRMHVPRGFVSFSFASRTCFDEDLHGVGVAKHVADGDDERRSAAI